VTVQAGTGSTPGPWYVDIPLAPPFRYDPTSGNDLVIDIMISGALIGSSFGVDHASSAGSPPPLGTRLLNSTSSAATTATSRDLNYCLVTEFTHVPGAGYRVFGAGCAGSAGVPSNVATALPVLGQSMTAVIGNLPPASVVFFALGFSNTVSLLGPLPASLAPFGAPGCFLRVSTDANVLVVGSGGSASFNLGIPNSAGYIGLRFYTQALSLDGSANAMGGTTSDAAAAIIGH
jgi:hypothetical protein